MELVNCAGYCCAGGKLAETMKMKEEKEFRALVNDKKNDPMMIALLNDDALRFALKLLEASCARSF